MLQFLQSNVSLIVGPVLALLLIGIRALSSDRVLRRDLTGSILLLLAFLALRLAEAGLGDRIPEAWHKWLRVAWMLTFAFGVIRAGVSFGLLALRFRSATPTPKILRDVLDATLYVIAVIPILKSQLDFDLTGLVATSAILSVVLGLALQDTLGNLFAGLSLQLERPYQVGDWVTIKDITGRVVQVAWRATRLETFRREVVTLPNNVCSKEAVKNYSRGGLPVGVDIYFHASYSVPPNEVKAAVLDILEDVPLVLKEPRPMCRTWRFDDNGVRYQARYFVADFAQADWAMEDIYTRLWYRFRRDGIQIPLPQRTLHLHTTPPPEDISKEEMEALLREVDLFAVFSAEERLRLRDELVPRRFGRGEHIIEEGAEGNTFYLVGMGEVSVRTGKSELEVSRLRRGQYFGEMSLLTGEPRAATVVAHTDVVLLELGRPAFARLFAAHPELAPKVSAVLAQRRTQLRAASVAPGGGGGGGHPAPEAGHILGRLKSIFGLS